MPDVGRCLELIHQGIGSVEEKYECASMGYWGNRPIIPAYSQTFLGYPVALPAVSPELFYQFDVTGGKMRRCGSCNCGGGGGSAYAGPGGSGSSFGSGSGSGFGSGSGSAGGSSIGFNVQFSGLLLLLIVVVAVWRRKK